MGNPTLTWEFIQYNLYESGFKDLHNLNGEFPLWDDTLLKWKELFWYVENYKT